MGKLSYSFHIGNDKNKSKKSRQTIKDGKVVDKVFNNNAIQNANQLSRANNHNLRKYDNNQEKIEILRGTNDLYKDVVNLYIKEFDDARIKYNENQTRNDRKIENYFENISKNEKTDLACEIIIELGKMSFWKRKTEKYRRKMTGVFIEQINELERVAPSFKIANATIHYDESSPHLHIVGVPVKNGNKNGMEKQVGKSTIFTKDSLRMIQDAMRLNCINSFNKIYNTNKQLEDKEDGRGYDIASRDMDKKYGKLKRQADKNKQRLEKVNESTKKTLEKSKQVKEIVNNLKPTKLIKNNYLISDNDINTINEYIENVDSNVNKIKSVNDLTNLMENFENALNNHYNQIDELEDTIDEKDEKIQELESSIKDKDNTIQKKQKKIEGLKLDIETLNSTISTLNEIIEKLKEAWKKLLDFLIKKLYSNKEKDSIYGDVIIDMSNNEIFSDEDKEYITTSIQKLENETDFDYYETKKEDDYEL